MQPVISLPKLRGRPFRINEISEKIDEILGVDAPQQRIS